MHSEILELIFELSRVFRRVNFMSQRLDLLAELPALLEAELAADKRSYTLGIEGISERMRNYYRKGIDERQIYAAIGRLALPAVREIKLFYIIAGFEDEKDIAEFADFAHQIAQTRRLAAPSQRIIVSAGYLARLPFTPLQFAPLCLDRERLETVADRIEAACAAAGLEFRLAVDFEEHYVDQLLALGGSALAPWLGSTCRTGINYDTHLSTGTGADLEAFAAALGPGLLDEAFLGEKGEDWQPPLAFIDSNIDALRKNYLLASRFAPKERLSPAALHRDPEFQAKLERLMDAKRHFASIFIRIALPRVLARATAEYRSAWILRAIFAASPSAVATVFDAQEELFSKGGSLEGFADRFWGISCYRLLGPDAKRLAEAAREAGFEVLDERPVPARIEVEMEISEAFAREAEETLKAWLFDERISFVERRTARARLLECAPRDLRKKILFGAQLIGPESSESGSFEIRLSMGAKARVASWLSRLSYPASRSVSLRILAIESR